MQKGAKIGFISRIDYGSDGFRKAAIVESFNRFKSEGTHFNVLVGGLVAGKALAEEMKAFVKAKSASLRPADRAGRKAVFEDQFLRQCARELAKSIPVLTGPNPERPGQAAPIKLYIVPSPAFDGEIGERVAFMLGELRRDDIIVEKSGSARLVVKYVNKLIWVLTPVKGVWMRGDYYSTPVERVIKDKIKQTSQGSPDLYVVGCFGASIHKPKGELKYQYVSVPVCHRLEETRVAENQVGLSVLEYPPDGGPYQYRVYNLKDLVHQELSFIVPPERSTSVQKKIIERIKVRGSASSGVIGADLGLAREVVERELKSLMRKKTFRRAGENWPGIYYQESSRRYYFDLNEVKNKLRYAPQPGPFQEDRIVSFACLHAGSVETDYEYFLNTVPEFILRHDAQVLIGAGDITEGTEHSLMMKQEIIDGANNSAQEEAAATMVARVILKVFAERFNRAMGETDKAKLSQDKLAEIVRSSLLTFNYIPGNHDLWVTKYGFDPLKLFHANLLVFLTEGVGRLLGSHNLSCQTLNNLVQEKVLSQNLMVLGSGLKLSVQHPHMARAKTTSIRPQEMLEFGKRLGATVVVGANFHVSELVDEWDMDLGQTVCMQIGTIKHGSNFERNKMKTVDQGVGYLRVVSKDGRILLTESVFDGAKVAKDPIRNTGLRDFIAGLK